MNLLDHGRFPGRILSDEQHHGFRVEVLIGQRRQMELVVQVPFFQRQQLGLVNVFQTVHGRFIVSDEIPARKKKKTPGPSVSSPKRPVGQRLLVKRTADDFGEVRIPAQSFAATDVTVREHGHFEIKHKTRFTNEKKQTNRRTGKKRQRVYESTTRRFQTEKNKKKNEKKSPERKRGNTSGHKHTHGEDLYSRHDLVAE